MTEVACGSGPTWTALVRPSRNMWLKESTWGRVISCKGCKKTINTFHDNLHFVSLHQMTSQFSDAIQLWLSILWHIYFYYWYWGSVNM